MWDCIRCNNSNSDEDIFCTECGTIKANTNYCNNVECEAYKILLSDSQQKYCGKCGKPTIYAEGKTTIKLPSAEFKGPVADAFGMQ